MAILSALDQDERAHRKPGAGWQEGPRSARSVWWRLLRDALEQHKVGGGGDIGNSERFRYATVLRTTTTMRTERARADRGLDAARGPVVLLSRARRPYPHDSRQAPKVIGRSLELDAHWSCDPHPVEGALNRRQAPGHRAHIRRYLENLGLIPARWVPEVTGCAYHCSVSMMVKSGRRAH